MSPMPTWQRVVLLLLIGVAFALRLHELTLQNIWWDEARNIDVALRPFWQIPTAPELDIHPPIYFWLLHLWSRMMGLGDSTQINVASLATPTQLAFIVRSLSAYANVLGVVLIFCLVRLWPAAETPQHSRHASRSGQAALLAAFVAALSPFWLAESQEARMYTVSFTFILVAALGLVKGIISPSKPSPNKTSPNKTSPNKTSPNKTSPSKTQGSTNRHLVFFVLFSALALLTHYNALFIVVSWYLWWGVWSLLQPNRWTALKRVVGCGLLMSALVLPIAPIALRQIPGYSNPNLTVPTISRYLAANWQAYFGGYAYQSDWLHDINPRFGNITAAELWLWAIGVMAIIGIVAQVWKLFANRDTATSRPYLSFLLVWLIGGLALYYIAVIDRGAFNPRYSSLVTPALYGLVAIGMVSWPAQGFAGRGFTAGRLLAIAGVGILAIGFVPAVYADLYDERYAREDMQQTTEWLRSNAGPNDIIFVDQKYPIGFYYERFVIDPDDIYPTGLSAPARYLFVDINTIDQRLNQWAASAERIFWLQWFESDTDPRGSVSFLLDQIGTWSGEKQFRGYTVDWWAMQPPTRFSLAPTLEDATYIFPPAVETVELSIPETVAEAANAIPVVIRWKRVTEGWIDRPLKARVALYPEGEDSRKSQDDRPILNDRHLMPAEWAKDDRPLNVYSVPLTPNLQPGIYDLKLLIYDAESLEPLTYVDLAGNPAGIEAVIGQVTIE